MISAAPLATVRYRSHLSISETGTTQEQRLFSCEQFYNSIKSEPLFREAFPHPSFIGTSSPVTLLVESLCHAPGTRSDLAIPGPG